eukprot:1271816-Rhodomonas_salina.1
MVGSSSASAAPARASPSSLSPALGLLFASPNPLPAGADTARRAPDPCVLQAPDPCPSARLSSLASLNESSVAAPSPPPAPAPPPCAATAAACACRLTLTDSLSAALGARPTAAVTSEATSLREEWKLARGVSVRAVPSLCVLGMEGAPLELERNDIIPPSHDLAGAGFSTL